MNATLVSVPSHGTLTLNSDGTFSYTHDGSETTSDSFTYRANDGTADGIGRGNRRQGEIDRRGVSR